MAIDDRIIDLLLNGTPGMRKELCRQEPMYFAIWYFPEYFTHQIPNFHYDFYQDIKDLMAGNLDEAAWIAFRDSAKSSIAKIALICWAVCFKLEQYINVDSYDKSNAESILFDVTVALQTNKKIIRDFGHLYHKKPTKDALSEAKMKRISNFITENDVKVEAFSTQESTRGRLYKNMRPGLILFDDFETNKTKDSYPVIHKIKEHIDEWRAGRAAHARALYLGNYIVEGGVVEYVMDNLNRSARGKVRLINAADKDGNPSWPAKHTKTKTEAELFNQTITDPRQRKVSLEERREQLGNSVYEAEMMNNPAHGGDKVFDRDIIEGLLKGARAPIRAVAGFKIWKEYDPSHRYAIGADTAKGIGKDANAAVLIDFSSIPNKVIGTYKNNLMAPDIFAFELKREGEMYGQCLVAPEINNTGYATVTQLKRIYKNIFVGVKDEKIKAPVNDEYGWDTNSATKPEMIFQLKRALEDGLLVAFDEDLLNEAKYYGQKDLMLANKLVDGMTRHYDLLTACAIAWQMRSYAKIPNMQKKPLNQTVHTPIAGEYGG